MLSPSRHLNSVWFLDTLLVLGNYYWTLKKEHFSSPATYQKISQDPVLKRYDIQTHWALLTKISFQVGTLLVQHLCARIGDNSPGKLKKRVAHGVAVLYWYIFRHWQSEFKEKDILNALRVQNIPGLTIEPVTEVFDRYEEVVAPMRQQKQDPFEIARCSDMAYLFTKIPSKVKRDEETVSHTVCNQLFRLQHNSVYTPTHLIGVPWMDAVSLVKHKRYFFLHKGIVYLTYMQIAEWMYGRWVRSVEQWFRYDQKEINEPWLVGQMEARKHRAPPTISDECAYDMWHERFHKNCMRPLPSTKQISLGLAQFEQEELYEPLKQTDLFFAPEKPTELVYNRQTLNRQGLIWVDPRIYLPPLYQPFFEYGRKMDHLLSVELTTGNPVIFGGVESTTFDRYSVSGPLPTIAYRPNTSTGDLLTDYGRIMPPCIYNLVMGNVRDRTHLKYQERLVVFWWAFQASIPLKVLADSWAKIIDNDSSVSPREVNVLKGLPEHLYKEYEKRKRSGKPYNFYGCQKMPTCPYSSTTLGSGSSLLSSPSTLVSSSSTSTETSASSLLSTSSSSITGLSSSSSSSSTSTSIPTIVGSSKLSTLDSPKPGEIVGDIEDLRLLNKKRACGEACWSRNALGEKDKQLPSPWPGASTSQWSPMFTTFSLACYAIDNGMGKDNNAQLEQHSIFQT